MNPLVDEFINNAPKWQEELTILRNIILQCQLTEEIKWKQPCYTFNGKNIVLIHGFKEYCALLFMKGALLSDAENILIQQTENVQEGRQIRFTSGKEIIEKEAILKAYIYEAIEVEKAGLKVPSKNDSPLILVEEFQNKLNESPELASAFQSLTPGRQRAYNLYFSAPKQSKTRTSRVESYIPRILIGKGFHDCICGLTKKSPNCDGSHNMKKS